MFGPSAAIKARAVLEHNLKALGEGVPLHDFDVSNLTKIMESPGFEGPTVELHADPPAGKRHVWKVWFRSQPEDRSVFCFSGNVTGAWKDKDGEGVYASEGILECVRSKDGSQSGAILYLD